MTKHIRTIAAAFAVALTTTSAHAAWTTLSTPPLSQGFGTYLAGHLSDGRFLYASNNDLDRQQTFGAATLADYANAATWDPAGIAIHSDALGALGVGGFGASQIVTFDPSNLATPFTAIPGVALQNYSFAFRDAAGLYVGGGNGSELNGFGFGKHSISYVSLDGSVNKVIIDNVSEFSGAIAVDLAGNLYVSDNDFAQPQLYKFTAAQLSGAITGLPVAIEAGQLLGVVNADGSFAVDDLGRVWTAGYQINGIEVFDPANGTLTAHTPALANSNYTVATFLRGGESYVAALNAAGASTGSAVTYSFEKSAALVPEPASAVLLALGAFALLRRRRRA